MTPHAAIRTGPDVILGTVHRMRFESIEPLLTSLQATGCRARLVLFASRLDNRTRRLLTEQGVILIPFRSLLIRMRNPLAYLWPLLRPFGHPALPTAVRFALGRWGMNLMNLRFFLYRRWLVDQGNTLRNVMLSDIRDVWFQGDPFGPDLPRGVSVFLEETSIPIASSPANADWVRRTLGENTLREIAHHPVSCAGVTLGDAESMRQYVETICERLLRTPRPNPVAGEDQGIHNWIAWTPQPFPVHRFANYEGRVLTMGCMPRESVRLSSDGQVLDPTGRPIPVLHQYDRHLEREGTRLRIKR